MLSNNRHSGLDWSTEQKRSVTHNEDFTAVRVSILAKNPRDNPHGGNKRYVRHGFSQGEGSARKVSSMDCLHAFKCG